MYICIYVYILYKYLCIYIYYILYMYMYISFKKKLVSSTVNVTRDGKVKVCLI